MKWVAISGTWRVTTDKVEKDVRERVRQVIENGDGIVTGGALGVDFYALDEAMKSDPKAERIRIILPVKLDAYENHYKKRADEGVISHQQAQSLIDQLEALKGVNPAAIYELENQVVEKETYYMRDTEVIKQSDELIAFQVNKSLGTQDTIDKARSKGIPVKVFQYVV